MATTVAVASSQPKPDDGSASHMSRVNATACAGTVTFRASANASLPPQREARRPAFATREVVDAPTGSAISVPGAEGVVRLSGSGKFTSADDARLLGVGPRFARA